MVVSFFGAAGSAHLRLPTGGAAKRMFLNRKISHYERLYTFTISEHLHLPWTSLLAMCRREASASVAVHFFGRIWCRVLTALQDSMPLTITGADGAYLSSSFTDWSLTAEQSPQSQYQWCQEFVANVVNVWETLVHAVAFISSTKHDPDQAGLDPVYAWSLCTMRDGAKWHSHIKHGHDLKEKAAAWKRGPWQDASSSTEKISRIRAQCAHPTIIMEHDLRLQLRRNRK